MLAYIVHIVVVLFMPPLLRGIIIRTKARFAGRVGAPIWQPYYDLVKLFRKDFVFSTTTTWMFKAGPVVVLVTALLASLIVPLGHDEAPLAFTGDCLLFAYLLALGRFFIIAAALDTGSAFEGMGTARESTFGCLTEIALFFGLLVLAQISGSPPEAAGPSLSMSALLSPNLVSNWEQHAASLILLLFAWFIVMLAENSRIPFDDPNTHLELTMIHEVIVLDHGGPVLGMLLYGAAIKLFVFCALVVQVAIPLRTGMPWLNWLIFIGATAALAAVIGVVESVMARLKMTEIPKLLATACVLSALAIVLLIK